MASAVSAETERVLLERRAALTSLTSHPNWPELEAELGRKTARIEKLVIAKTLAGRGPIDNDELIYLRGFVHGMRWLASVPPAAENALEKFLQAQGLRTEEETTA